jgi:acyl carrier protein
MANRAALTPDQRLMQRVREIVAKHLDTDEAEIDLATSFEDDLGADSLDRIEMVMAFEDAFDINISDEQVEKFKTVQDLFEFLRDRAKVVA